MRLSMITAAALAAAVSFSANAQDARPRRGARRAVLRQLPRHGWAVRPGGTPSLGGQPAEFVTLQMILFREGLRTAPPMNDIAQGLHGQGHRGHGRAFRRAAAGAARGSPRPRRRAVRAGQGALRPHELRQLPPAGYAGRNQIPRIAAQREEYLGKTLAEYRDNKRVGSDTQMNAVMYNVRDADIAALAHYLSQLD
jgi:cytochrome c553